MDPQIQWTYKHRCSHLGLVASLSNVCSLAVVLIQPHVIAFSVFKVLNHPHLTHWPGLIRYLASRLLHCLFEESATNTNHSIAQDSNKH